MILIMAAITVSSCAWGGVALWIAHSDLRRTKKTSERCRRILLKSHWLLNHGLDAYRRAEAERKEAVAERKLAQLIKSHHGTEEVNEG